MLCGEIFVINIKIKHCVDAGWCIITRAATKRPLCSPAALISLRLFLFSPSVTSKCFSLLTFYSISNSFLPCPHFSLSLTHSEPLLLPLSLSLPSLLLILFLIPPTFSLPSLPSPLRHQLYTHRSCFHGVSQRFWQSALETQDHFK